MKVKVLVGLVLCFALASCSEQKTAQEHIVKGKEFFQQKNWPSAVIEFKNAVKVAPEDSMARLLLGQSYLEIHNYPAAIKELDRARRLGYDENQLILPLAKAYLAINDHASILEEIKVSDGQSLGVQAQVHAIRGLALLSGNKSEQAHEELKSARRIDESAEQVRLAWGRFEQSRGNTGAQKDWIKPLLDKNGGVADAWSQMGDLEVGAGNHAEAEKAYSRAIELRRYTTPDQARRALVRIELKKFDEAQQDVDVLKAAGLAGPIVMQADALIAFHQERRDEAKTRFHEILSLAPEYLPPRYMLALIYFAEKDFTSANTHLNIYTEKNPGHRPARYLHAATLLQLGKAEEALPFLNDLLDKGPGDVRLYGLKGIALRQLARDKEAAEVFKEGLRQAPDNADLHYQLGLLLSREDGSARQGEHHLRRARELSSDSARANLALYLSYLRQKKFSEARALAGEFPAPEEGKTRGQNLIGLTYLAEGKIEQAISELEKVLQDNQGDAMTIQNLARIYVENNRLDDAKKLLSSAAEKNPANMQVLNQLAMISGRQGDRDEMLAWLKQSMEQNPDELSPKLLLALQQLRGNDAGGAIQVLNGVEGEGRNSTGYILLMSQAKLMVDEHQHSIRLLKSLLGRQPELSQAHFLLALAYSRNQDAKRMRESLDSTLQFAPKHFFASLYLARLDYLERRYDEFKRRVDHLASLDNENPDVTLLQARKASLEKNYAAAIKLLTGLRARHEHPDIYAELADNQNKAGKRGEAIKTLESWHQAHQDDTRIAFLLAQLYMEDSNYDRARAVYRQLEKTQPDNIVLLNNLAWLMQEVDIAAGLGYAERALEIEPRNPMIMDTVAMLQLANGQAEKALDLSSRAAAALPQNIEVQVNFARALVANGRTGKGRDVLVELKKIAKTARERAMIDRELTKL